MRTRITAIAILILIAGLLWVNKVHAPVKTFMPDTADSDEEIHYHAGFKVFQDGEQRDFTDFKYMSIIPCGEDQDEHDEDSDEHIVHLHDSIGDVVHIHAPDATWENVFKNLDLNTNTPLEAYNNGVPVQNPLDTVIKEYDSMVFLLGDMSGIDPTDQSIYVSKEYIQEKEQISENCGS